VRREQRADAPVGCDAGGGGIVNPLALDFMQRALVAALLVGLAAPAVGVFLVQRRLALMGDGIGHIALTGVALGFLLGTAPVLTAVVVATLGAVVIELVRQSGRTSGDVALALMFYGGIAGGVLLIGLSSDGTNANLLAYLFGSLTSVSPQDVVVISALSGGLLLTVAVVGRELFAVCHDEEHAKVAGLPVRTLNILLAVMAAITVTVAMRVVGLLLVSALMVVPVATAQQLVRGFRATVLVALGVGVVASLAGVLGSYYADTAPGAMIVVVALGGFTLASAAGVLVRRSRSVMP
jgi:zinc transport system permease protein